MKKGTKIIIVFTIIILCTLYIFYRKNIIEAFQEKKKFAIIIYGEGFRKGGQGNRNHGSFESYDEQKAGCKTQMDLVKKIESAGYDVDIFLDTYHTQFDDEMKSWYGENLKNSKFHETYLESFNKVIEDAMNMVRATNINYDVIFIMRTDLYFKELYIETYNPDTPTLQIFSMLWKKDSKTENNNPKINHTTLHFPNKYFDKIDSLFNGDLHYYLDIVNLEYQKDYSFLTDNFYDADSAKDFNHYYKMIGRPENPVWHSEGMKFPRDY